MTQTNNDGDNAIGKIDTRLSNTLERTQVEISALAHSTLYSCAPAPLLSRGGAAFGGVDSWVVNSGAAVKTPTRNIYTDKGYNICAESAADPLQAQ
eukprot:SAG11_NODE_8079_length_1062_cov_0.881620_2_plen_96_part_00